MRAVICVLLLAAAGLRADEAADRAAIEKVIVALNTGPTPGREAPMSEVSRPYYAVRSIEFITPDIALVDATSTQYGSMILVRKTHVVFVVKRVRDWEIAARRLPGEPR